MKCHWNTIFILFVISVPGFSQVQLSNQNATERSRLLYEELSVISHEYTLFGHQDDLAYGIGWWNEKGRSDVKEVSGSYPAVFGWELGHIGEERNIDSVKFDDIKKWIIQVDTMGGINTISWHMKNPIRKSSSWDTQSAVEKILPGGNLHDAYKEKLDYIASFMLDLIDTDGNYIPIVFRPFHEVNGSWFWWGGKNCQPENYVKLWQFTKYYLEEVKNVNHLIWCYCTDRFYSESDYFNYYPGDQMVDVLGFDDFFSPVNNPKHFSWELKSISEYASKKNKIAVLSEVGSEGILHEDFWTKNILSGFQGAKDGRGIAYMLFWRNSSTNHYFVPYKGHSSEKSFLKFKKDKHILFLNGLNQIRKEKRMAELEK